MQKGMLRAGRHLTIISFFFTLIVLLSLEEITARNVFAVPDSAQRTFPLSSDTVLSDTSSAEKTSPAADTTIHYFGDPIEFLIDSQKVILYGTPERPARVEYRNITLTAARIVVLLDSNLLRAEGIPDTASLSPGEPQEYLGTPVFEQKGQEPLWGERIEYNLKNKKGHIIHGRTKYETAYYSGEEITRVNSSVLQIRNGFFTTCDLEDHPHFYFKGKEMKIRLNDKVVARSVTLYIADVPVFYLPFAIFPIRRGRHSGFIIPTFGSSQLEGRYLRGLGYYYAPNEYMDVKGLVDFFEKSGFMFRGDTRYAKRYSMGGNLSGSITRKDFITGQKSRMWDLELHHKQELSPTSRLTVSGKFASSGSFYKNLSLDRRRRTTRELISNATFHKSWKESKHNLSVNVQRRHDLELGNISSTFPQIRFSRTTPVYPFRHKDKKRKKAGALPKKDESWFTNFNFRYNSTLIHRYTKRRYNIKNPYDRKTPRGIQNNINFLLPLTVFKYFNLSPSVSFREEWYDKTISQRFDIIEGIISGHERGFAARHLFNSQLSATTKIFGLFAPKIGNLQALRHVMTPTIGLSYRPDFSGDRFGYFKTVYDTVGIGTRYDRFGDAAFGRTPAGKVGALNFSLGNILQMKTGTEDEEKKRDLFNLNFSSGYNFSADRFALGDLTTSFRMLGYMDFDVAASHSFYQTDKTTGQRMDKYRSGLPRLQRFQATTSFRMKGGQDGEKEILNENREPGIITEDEYMDTVLPDREERFIKDEGTPSFSIPYEFRLGARYNIEQYNPLHKRKIFSAATDLNFNLTKHWKISHSAEIDMVNRRIIYQDFSFYRDLHCFEFRFNWTPTGALKGYYLNIRIKNPMLRDLKIEDRSYGGSVLGRR